MHVVEKESRSILFQFSPFFPYTLQMLKTNLEYALCKCLYPEHQLLCIVFLFDGNKLCHCHHEIT